MYIFGRSSEKWGSDYNIVLCNCFGNLFYLVWRINACWLDNKCILLVFIFQVFCNFLCSQSKIFYFFAMTLRTDLRHIILGFADMTKSYGISRGEFMIANTYRTVFAFRDISAVMTDDSSRIAFFIYKNSDFFSLSEIFFYSLKC